MNIKNELRDLSRVGNEEEIKNQALRVCLSSVKFPATKQEISLKMQGRCPREMKM